ncbi:MAG: ATP-dependent helicase DeaD [Hyphomicrobiales bacterium]|nr:ATP-dependent helicase DeaD [Hyphomicrobiales bacterium]
MAFPATNPTLARALTERDYLEATPVQLAVLKDDANGRDLLVSAQTGSGKTVAYGLAIAEDLLGEAEAMERAAAPLALVVAPTRELALQVHRELAWLYAGAKAKVVSCVGGMDPRRERRLLAEGAHIVVGTPGRLRDHIERKGLDVSQLKALVLDEADEMLDLGFREDLEEILKLTPRERRTLLFSATLPKTIVNLARDYQRNALRIEVGAGDRAHADIEYRAMRVLPNEVDHVVVNLLRFYEAPSALVFCNTREAVRHMHTALLERGFTAVALSGELSQNERTHALQSLRDGRARICVATDVAARGIDLPNLGLVIHAEIPNDAEILQHRSGRTGRAGKKGIAVLIVTQARRRRAERLLVDARVQPNWCGPPTVEEIRKLDQERLMRDEVFSEESSEEDLGLARALLAERSPEEVAAALVRMYRQRLPSPEDVTDPGHGRSAPPVRAERGTWAERNAAAPARTEGYEPTRERSPSPARAPRGGAGVWFHIDIGRKNNADPKWLLPMICKRGKVSRDQIGAIRIFDKETKFEVTADAAEAFAVAMMHPGKETKAGQTDLNFSRLDQSAPVAAPTKFNKKKREPFGQEQPGDVKRAKFRKETT